MSHPFRIAVVFLLFAALLLPGTVFAAPNKAKVTIEVKNGVGEDAVNLSKIYVVMYNIAVVDGEWWGTKAVARKIPAGKKTVTFNVKPDQVVDFQVFETFQDVLTNKKRMFYSPPFKNFSNTDDAGKLCYVAGVDFSEKLPDSQCTNELELIYSGSDAKVSVEVNDGVDVGKPLSNVAVGMYNVAIVNNEWWGELVQVKSIPAGKTKAVFSVTPGQIVDFLAFETKAEVKKVKKHHFTVPPYKNFSAEDGSAEVCHIAGVDITNKLQLASCGNEIGIALEK